MLVAGLGALRRRAARRVAGARASGRSARLLALAGLRGASVQSASGRAVMHWFPPAQRGLALGDPADGDPDQRLRRSRSACRRSSRAGGVELGLRGARASPASPGRSSAALVLREGPRRRSAGRRAGRAAAPRPADLAALDRQRARCSRRSSASSASPCSSCTSSAACPPGAAAAVLAVMQAARRSAAGSPPAAGRTCVGSRIAPLRAIALARVVFVALIAGAARRAARRARAGARRRRRALDELEQPLVRGRRRARGPRAQRRRDRAAADAAERARRRSTRRSSARSSPRPRGASASPSSRSSRSPAGACCEHCRR